MPAGSHLRERAEHGAGTFRPARALRGALATEAVERFAADAAVRILDAGCGEGLLTVGLAQAHPSWALEGVDRDPSELRRGALRAERAGVENVEFRLADLTDGLGDATYDVVLAIECLTEIPDAEAALATMAARVRPGGLLVVHVPEATWHPVLRGSDTTWRHELRHGFTPAHLRSLLEAYGFEDISIRHTTHAPVHLAQEIRDRLKHTSLKVRLAIYPVLRACLAAERAGLRVGAGRGLMVAARRPSPVPRSHGSAP